MGKEENVVNFYLTCNKLKHLIRSGWKMWNVETDRLESVAEHVYSVQMLAIAMTSEYKYDVDLTKVIMMLAVHELEECIIGDLVYFEITPEEKNRIGHEAVSNILSGLLLGDEIKNLILEFDKRETSEARFAYYCDKFECDLQCKIYDEMSYVDVKNPNNKVNVHDPLVGKMLESGSSWSEMWLTFSQSKYNYDKNFMEVSNYVKTHEIVKKRPDLH